MSEAWIVEEEVVVAAGAAELWRALTEGEALAQWYFPGIAVESTYAVGGAITFAFTLDGVSYRDHGRVVACVAERVLSYEHSSSLSGREDAPEGRTLVTIELQARREGTAVVVRQERFALATEFFHARFFWRGALAGLKALVEGR